ncbi:MAG: DsrE family protein [Campylobacterales bacterium]|nr:DsrE family protein [Campylobacterales bacterium]
MKILVSLLAFFGLLFAEGDVKKVVIDLTTGDTSVFEKKILSGVVAHKTHYENSFEELEVAVVIHGGAYRFFLKDPSNTVYRDDAVLREKFAELKKRTETLSSTYNVEFLMCDVGRKKNKLELSNIAEYVKIVPNSTIGLIDKQSEGYAYIPVSK